MFAWLNFVIIVIILFFICSLGITSDWKGQATLDAPAINQ